MNNLGYISYYISYFILCMLAVGLMMSRLYKKAHKELSFVRTGLGGEKIVMNGGALVLPYFHDVIFVNMNTINLPVHRQDDLALITQDRMRVDVVAEFYVRVQPTSESIANAAQTLGLLTTEPLKLKQLVEGKFVDALRSVASAMSMEELHEKRVDFVHKVQNALIDDLLKNGLELETVSLTNLDQTSMDYFNPNNAFDAEGLTKLTEAIQTRRKKRNDIEQDTDIQIKTKNLEATKIKLALKRDEEYAEFERQKEIDVKRFEQASLTAKEQAENEKKAEQARILSNQEVDASKISAKLAIEQKEIDKKIAISEKSKAESIAKAEAEKALAHAVAAEEQVVTAREQEIAERLKVLELIEAAKQAESDAIAIKVAAEAEKMSTIDKGKAIRELAQAEADKLQITAEAEAHAEKIKAEASEIKYRVEAAGHSAINDAANILSDNQISMQVKMKLIENLEGIIKESVKFGAIKRNKDQ